jgi:hypothetical protein
MNPNQEGSQSKPRIDSFERELTDLKNRTRIMDESRNELPNPASMDLSTPIQGFLLILFLLNEKTFNNRRKQTSSRE